MFTSKAGLALAQSYAMRRSSKHRSRSAAFIDLHTEVGHDIGAHIRAPLPVEVRASIIEPVGYPSPVRMNGVFFSSILASNSDVSSETMEGCVSYRSCSSSGSFLRLYSSKIPSKPL